MRQELIDLILGELEPSAADALKKRIAGDARLQNELKELESLFGLMRRGEEIEPPAELRAAIFAEAERVSAPSLLQQLRQLPGLVAYRFRCSLRFRVAAISLGAHVVLMVFLFNLFTERPAADDRNVDIGVIADIQPQRPERGFVVRLLQRQLPHETRLRQFGAEGQAEAIRQGLDAILASQKSDGSFGNTNDTATATLALLAEGNSSADPSPRGRAIEGAVRHLIARARAGDTGGAILSALVEDYSLAYERLGGEERIDYVAAIRGLILSVGDDDMAREGLALASLAGFVIPGTRDLGDAAYLLGGNRAPLLAKDATRLRASIVLARGHSAADRDAVREWARPLFERALADLRAGKVSGEVLLSLQAPYRL